MLASSLQVRRQVLSAGLLQWMMQFWMTVFLGVAPSVVLPDSCGWIDEHHQLASGRGLEVHDFDRGPGFSHTNVKVWKMPFRLLLSRPGGWCLMT